MSKNALIPLSLLRRIITLLETIDISNDGRYDSYSEHRAILDELNFKMKKLDLHNAYRGIILAEDEETMDVARIEYLKQRMDLRIMKPYHDNRS